MEKQQATLGGGCFWCLEAVYQQLKGVSKVTSGYAGGPTVNPTYQQVCSGSSGHAEVIQIEFDASEISYEDILYVFWRLHDPTTLNSQGADKGTQYRSIILTHDEEQQTIALKSKEEADASNLWPNPIVTELTNLEVFYPAESYHQNYYLSNPNQPYCQIIIDPKLQKLRHSFADKLK